MLVTKSCLTVCDPVDCSPPGSSVHGSFWAKILKWVASHFLLQGIFPTQESNLGLLYCKQILYCLSHQGNLYAAVSPLKIMLPFSTQKRKGTWILVLKQSLIMYTSMVWTNHPTFLGFYFLVFFLLNEGTQFNSI